MPYSILLIIECLCGRGRDVNSFMRIPTQGHPLCGAPRRSGYIRRQCMGISKAPVNPNGMEGDALQSRRDSNSQSSAKAWESPPHQQIPRGWRCSAEPPQSYQLIQRHDMEILNNNSKFQDPWQSPRTLGKGNRLRSFGASSFTLPPSPHYNY